MYSFDVQADRWKSGALQSHPPRPSGKAREREVDRRRIGRTIWKDVYNLTPMRRGTRDRQMCNGDRHGSSSDHHGYGVYK